MKGHTASHRSPYQRLGIATPTPLGHLWGTTASKPEHVSRFTQQLGGKGGKTWPTDGLGSTLQVYTYSSKHPTFQYGLHTLGSNQDSHCQAPMRPSPSQGGAQNRYKKPALLGLKPDGILIHSQQYNAPGLLNKSTPSPENGCNFSFPGHHTIPFPHQPAIHQKDNSFVAGRSTMHHSTKKCNCKPPKGQKPPEGYVCHLCFTAGHYIYDCRKVSRIPIM